MKVMREMEFCPVGPGTVFNQVNQISDTIRERYCCNIKEEIKHLYPCFIAE